MMYLEVRCPMSLAYSMPSGPARRNRPMGCCRSLTRSYGAWRRENWPTNRPVRPSTLINNITTNIAPETWDETGGPGTIQPFTNSAALAISQTTGVHEEIVEYLRSLREAGAAQNQQSADANR
jgi:hypothetical protein